MRSRDLPTGLRDRLEFFLLLKNLHHSETGEFCKSQDKLSPLILGKRCNQESSIQIENEGIKLSETAVKVLFNPCSFSDGTCIALQDLKQTGRKQHKHQQSKL